METAGLDVMSGGRGTKVVTVLEVKHESQHNSSGFIRLNSGEFRTDEQTCWTCSSVVEFCGKTTR